MYICSGHAAKSWIRLCYLTLLLLALHRSHVFDATSSGVRVLIFWILRLRRASTASQRYSCVPTVWISLSLSRDDFFRSACFSGTNANSNKEKTYPFPMVSACGALLVVMAWSTCIRALKCTTSFEIYLGTSFFLATRNFQDCFLTVVKTPPSPNSICNSFSRSSLGLIAFWISPLGFLGSCSRKNFTLARSSLDFMGMFFAFDHSTPWRLHLLCIHPHRVAIILSSHKCGMWLWNLKRIHLSWKGPFSRRLLTG